jgi:hypothetical protein
LSTSITCITPPNFARFFAEPREEMRGADQLPPWISGWG